MVPHLRQARARASHFHLLLGSVIVQLVVALVTAKAGSPAAFPRLAMEKGSRRVVAVVSFVARSSPELARFAFVLFGLSRFAAVDLVIAAAADPCSPAAPDLAAVVGSVGFAAGSVVAVDLSVAVDSAETVFVVAADSGCSVDSVCSFAAAMEKGRGRIVAALSCSLIPRSSF